MSDILVCGFFLRFKFESQLDKIKCGKGKAEGNNCALPIPDYLPCSVQHIVAAICSVHYRNKY